MTRACSLPENINRVSHNNCATIIRSLQNQYQTYPSFLEFRRPYTGEPAAKQPQKS